MKGILLDRLNKSSSELELIIKSLTITHPPTKTSYLSGETFSKTELVVTATYGYKDTIDADVIKDVTDHVIVTPQILTDGVTSVKLSMLNTDGKEVYVTQTVTVNPKLISITAPSVTREYEYGDTFNESKNVIATYSDGSSKTVLASYPATIFSIVDDEISITYSYTENGITKTDTVTVWANRKSVAKPIWKNVVLTYNGNEQYVNSSAYWNNYNEDYWNISDYTGTDAGTYTTRFSLQSFYRWSDQSTIGISYDWNIAKATGHLSVNVSSVKLSEKTPTCTITINKTDGTLSWTPTSISSMNFNYSGNTFTISAKEKLDYNGTLTFKLASSSNYTTPDDVTINLSASYWEWGDEAAVGDANWWAGLKSALPSMSTSEKEALVGKKKCVTLSESWQGIVAGSPIPMICIGVDWDRHNSATFQVQYCGQSEALRFTDANIYNYELSNAMERCNLFATKCSAYRSIIMLPKDTYTPTSDGSWSKETVSYFGWSLSNAEMGANNIAGFYNEYTSGGVESNPYPYYNSDSRRIKGSISGDGEILNTISIYYTRSCGGDNQSVTTINRTGMAQSSKISSVQPGFAPAFTIG